MRLYIVRHAWAYERDVNRWPDDGQRPLTAEGRARFAKVAKALAQRGFDPTAIATSPLIRCRETADLLLARLPRSTQLAELDALAPGSDLKQVMEWTRQRQGEDVAWVGHSPDVEELTAALIGDAHASLRFSKGAAAAIRFERLGSGHGQLEWLVTAKLLGC